jgi:hypothetical protein
MQKVPSAFDWTGISDSIPLMRKILSRLFPYDQSTIGIKARQGSEMQPAPLLVRLKSRLGETLVTTREGRLSSSYQKLPWKSYC